MEAFLIKTFNKLKKDAPKRLKELKQACEDQCKELERVESSNDTRENTSISNESNADRYFTPLQLACESRAPKLMEVGLDAIHYLIEHNYLRGKTSIETAPPSSTSEENPENSTVSRTLIDLLVETVSKCSDEFDDNVQLYVIKVLLTAVTSIHCEVHEASLLLAVRACFHIHLISKNQVNKTTAKAALTQMLSVANQRMEIMDQRLKSSDTAASVTAVIAKAEVTAPEDEIKENSADDSTAPTAAGESCGTHAAPVASREAVAVVTFPSLSHKDSFLLFRALCKLSMKGLQDESGSQSDPIALQNKILSLELILHMLQHSGPAFRSEERFIYAVRNYLCVSLLGNCTSQVAQVTGLSLQIFVCLIEGFKNHLKNELEVFVSNIFLRILDSENSSFDHKMRVLEVFHSICKDPTAQVELFINYDCDFESIDLFRRIIDGLAKIAKNPSTNAQSARSVDSFMSSTTKRIQHEEQSMRSKGVEGLVLVLRSLVASAGFKRVADDSSEPSATKTRRESVASPLKSPSNGGAIDTSDITLEEAAEVSAAGADSSNIVEVFDRKQRIQEDIGKGILKFNLSPKKGIAYLAGLGLLEKTPRSVAAFLHQYKDRLDKTEIGNYLGTEKEAESGFCVKVLYEYVDCMDFTNMVFDSALRYFLSGFRLPGEAQKVDRLMQTFGNRYYLQNRETFASADLSYILAFSTIMLQTNLHNPAIREERKMSKEQFIKQNKGISSDGELSEELLGDIYTRIAASPISITDDEKAIKKAKKEEQVFLVFQTSSDKRRKDAFNNERKEMVRASEAMFKQKVRRGGRMRTSDDTDDAYVRPMFDIVWAPITGVFSQILETYDDPSMVQMCLEGLQYAIQLACRLDFPTARNTYINALTKFTSLDTVKEMSVKNIECMKAVLDVALNDGEYLEEGWTQVLQCISQLSRLLSFANSSVTDDMFFGGDDRSETGSADMPRNSSRRLSLKSFSKSDRSNTSNSTFSDPFSKLFGGPSIEETNRALEKSNAEVLSREINSTLIDRVFVTSDSLSSDAVLHFVRSLCEVSNIEISANNAAPPNKGRPAADSSSSNPRVFSLQKLVEVADFNMYSRPRVAWSNIWTLLASHFTNVGCNDNHALAMYAIDSLKQLSIKFLQIEELSNFNFQRVFLKPFEVIISRSKSSDIRNLVLLCIDIMIKACAANIRSGWRTIFAIFEVAASQDVLELANIAYEITERLMTSHFTLLVHDFVELMNCLVSFSAGQHISLSLRALSNLAVCADHLAQGGDSLFTPSSSLTPSDSSESKSSIMQVEVGQDASVFRLWWPLLLGLSTRVADNRLQVRMRALETLAGVLRKYGHIFSSQTWGVIFKGVLFPIVDSAKTDATAQPESSYPSENPPPSTNRNSWIGTMGQTTLSVCLELYRLFKDKSDAINLLPETFQMLESCVCQDTESLARIGAKTLNELIVSLGDGGYGNLITATTADLMCNRIHDIVQRNLCTNFGDVGTVALLEAAPAAVQDICAACPLHARRRSKYSQNGSSNDVSAPSFVELGLPVKTPYGNGKIVKIEQAYTVIQYSASGAAQSSPVDIPMRKCVTLGWGVLYTTETLKLSHEIEGSASRRASSSTMAPRLNQEQAWRQIASSAMTSMVVTLQLTHMIERVFLTYMQSFCAVHISTLLDTLEICYWHARSFNEDSRLRSKLRQRRFMTFIDDPSKLPHLLDQEISSINIIVDVVHMLYVPTTTVTSKDATILDSIVISTISSVAVSKRAAAASMDTFAEDWIQRVCPMVLSRYMELESKRATSTAVDKFLSEQYEAYTPVVLAILSTISTKFSKKQFASNVKWFVPILSKLIMCGKKEVRELVKAIYEAHVNPAFV